MISYDKFRAYFNQIEGYEPEIRIIFDNRKSEYMIIKYSNYITFQRCGVDDGSDEVIFKDLDDLYKARTIDDILLKEDWNRIKDIILDD